MLFIAIVGFCIFFFTRSKKVWVSPNDTGAPDKEFLAENIAFYHKLSKAEKERFESDIRDFLSSTKITGVDTQVSETDKLMIAAGAVIPVFYFPSWKYHNLEEVLVYSDQFNSSFESTGENERMIMGMVGSGYMEGKMLLSRPALQLGFKNQTDKNNTVIHEFVHLIDKMDGDTDGVPELLLQRQYILPWVTMIHEEIKKIVAGKSDINPYGYTKQSEFFAVVAEYFFERPELLQTKHPELYEMLDKIFRPASISNPGA
jgi:Mlc titration factor MtfA (ptsG expression regulator)